MNASAPNLNPGVARLASPYVPRPLQASLHNSLKRFNVLVAHRRFGKTVFCINHLIDRALKCPLKRPFFAYIAPFRNQAKTIAWEYIKEYTHWMPGVEYNEAELKVSLPGGRTIQLFGSDNPDAMRGLYFDGVVLDEYAQINPSLWTSTLLPAMADRSGWAIFIGTPQGHDAFYEIYQFAQKPENAQDWFHANFKASQTQIIPKRELDMQRDAMRMETGDDDTYEQEFENSFEAAIKGAYYGKTIARIIEQGHVTDLPLNPKYPVHTAWDLGVGDSTAIWFFQVVGPRIQIIDFYEANGYGMDHYVKHLHKKPYVYGTHLAPHDIRNTEWGSGRTRLEQAQSLGVTFRVVPKCPIEDGINATRALLTQCWFDKTRCKQGLEALKVYRQKWDEQRKVFSTKPLHDASSNAADAARYLALGFQEYLGELPIVQGQINTRQPTLNELLSELDERNRNTEHRI